MVSASDGFMGIALEEAKAAAVAGEVPVGAVVVCNGEVVAKARNMRETEKNALAHAEILAINETCKKLNRWRLDDCEMFVTLQPCQMCMGAAKNARIRKVIYGAPAENPGLNHETELEGGVLETECAAIVREFFKQRR